MHCCSIRSVRTLCLAFLMSLLTVASSWGGGGQHYPNGAEDFAVGALPPPGTYLVNYLVFAQKDSVRDNSGNKVFPAFKGDVMVEVPRLIYVTPFTILGASYAMQAFLPFYSADLQAGSNTPSHHDILDSREKGIGDIIFSPLVLGWHFGPNLHTVFAVDTWAPTGNYDAYRPATQIISRNHWTVEPVVAVSYFFAGFDASLKLMYDFNTTNHQYFNQASGTLAKLDPGQEFHMDWALGYSTKGGLTGGAVGYNYWQTTDDELNGTKVKNNKSRLGGAGVGLKYWPNHGPFSMTLKHYWEYDARNIAAGQQTQFKIAYAF
jgi:hypothetical protein